MKLADHFASKQVAVEVEGLFGVLDADHCLLEAGLANNFSWWHFLAPGEDFDPVIVWIKGKCNGLHASFMRSLLEFDTVSFKLLAKGHQIINDKADVTETPWV